MNDFVIGSNRSSMKKEEIAYGYNLMYRHYYIYDFMFTFFMIMMIAIITVTFHLVDPVYKIYITIVPFILTLIYGIYRMKHVLLKYRLIESQFSLNEPIVVRLTFYQTMFDLETHILGKIDMHAINYKKIKKIIYDKRIVVIVLKDQEKLICFNPIFFKQISLDQMLDHMKYENENIKITKMYV